jgi:hypothetical protein
MVRDVAETLDVFVSYSHMDREWVLNLISRLKQATRSGRPLSVGFDDQEFVPGVSLVRQIEFCVRSSARLVCVLSPEYLSSDWARLESEIKTIDDPSGRKGTLVPIIYRNCDVPYFLRIRLAADFRKKEGFEHSLRRLVWALGASLPGETALSETVPIPAGGPLEVPSSSDPEPVLERLSLNLFEAQLFPKEVWSAATRCTSATEVVLACGLPLTAEFVLRGGRLYSFDSLQDSRFQLTKAAAGSVKKHTQKEIASDADLARVHIELLNRTIGRRYREIGMTFDHRYQRYYFPLTFGEVRYVDWPGLKKKAKRRVSRAVRRENGEILRVEHAAIQPRFLRLGETVCLQLLPTRAITTDGLTPMRGRGVGTIVGKLTRRTYNGPFWLDVMFWLSLVVSRGPIKDNLGADRLIISSNPISSELGFGVAGDHLGLFSGEHTERWSEFAQEADDVEFADDDEDDAGEPDGGSE